MGRVRGATIRGRRGPRGDAERRSGRSRSSRPSDGATDARNRARPAIVATADARWWCSSTVRSDAVQMATLQAVGTAGSWSDVEAGAQGSGLSAGDPPATGRTRRTTRGTARCTSRVLGGQFTPTRLGDGAEPARRRRDRRAAHRGGRRRPTDRLRRLGRRGRGSSTSRPGPDTFACESVTPGDRRTGRPGARRRTARGRCSSPGTRDEAEPLWSGRSARTPTSWSRTRARRSS